MGVPGDTVVVTAEGTRPPGRSRGLDTAITSAGQVTVLLGAAVMGVVIGARFGATPETDGFFTANALYGLTLFLAQSLRTTAASRLLGDTRPFPRLAAHLDAIAVLVLASAVLAGLAVLGVGVLGVAPEARDTFRTSIVLLVPAAGFQLFAGLGSAALATADDFLTPTVAFGAGAGANVVAVLALTPVLGIDGVPLALACGSLITALIVARALVRRGWRPRAPHPSGEAARTAGRLTLGAGAAVASQIVLTVTVAASAAAVSGGATVFSYASMIIMVLTGGLASPLGVVFAPVVARTWDRRPETLVPLALRAYRAGALLLTPAAAAILLLGLKPAELLLVKVDPEDLREVFELVLILLPSVLGTVLSMIPMTGALAMGRLGALAGLSLAVAVTHALTCGIAAALGGGLMVLAAITTCSALALTLVPSALALGRHTGALVRGALSATADLIAIPATAFLAAGLALDAWSSLARGAAAFALGAAVTAAWLAARHRAEVASLIAAARPAS
jgi:O-antigen/teichoic acid export membrane protein